MDTGTRHYDFVFSMGQACTCSMTLRHANLQFASFPLDWVSGGTLAMRTNLVVSHFAGWLEKEDFSYHGVNPKNGLGVFINRRTDFRHPHDFPVGPIDQTYGEVCEKYRRRIERLYRMIDVSQRVLAAYVTRPDEAIEPVEELTKCRLRLAEAFPGKTFDLVQFVNEDGRAFADRRVLHPAEGVTQIVFGYRDPVRDVAFESTAQALTELGVTARDYRSDDARRTFDTNQRYKDAQRKKAFRLQRKMERYGVKTRLGLLLARIGSRLGLWRKPPRAEASEAKVPQDSRQLPLDDRH